MRSRALLVVALLVSGVLGGAAVLTAGDDDGGFSRRWLSGTGVPVTGNHHGVAAGRVDRAGRVFAPVSGEHGTDQCRLAALDATDGSTRWAHGVAPADCWIHSVGTPRLADSDADGRPEVIAPTAAARLLALDAADGTRELDAELSSYGYSEAVVGPLGADGERVLAVVDAAGTVFVLGPDGSTRWTHDGESFVWADPAVLDVTGDGRPELVVGFGDGVVTAFGPGGEIVWNRSLPAPGSLTWLSAAAGGEADDRSTVFVATESGQVSALAGADGAVAWSRDLGRFAAVGPAIDGDGDGDREVYATAADGGLRALEASTGSVEWETRLTDADVQMTPPPATGDVDGDGGPEVVATTNDGRVLLVDPADGAILAEHARTRPIWAGGDPVPIWAPPTLADTDGDGREEIYVMYGDGRVLSLSVGGE